MCDQSLNIRAAVADVVHGTRCRHAKNHVMRVLFVRKRVKMTMVITAKGGPMPSSAQGHAPFAQRGVSYDVPRARKSRLNAYLKIRPTSYRMTHRYARLQCFYRPPMGQKKPPGPEASRWNASSSRCAATSIGDLFDRRGLTRVNDYMRLRFRFSPLFTTS